MKLKWTNLLNADFMGKSKKKGGKRLKKKELAKMLIELFQRNPAEVYDIKRIFKELHLDTHPAKLLCMDLLEDLTADDYVKETENLHFRLNTAGQVFEAIFNRKANGKNTVTPVDGGEPVFVAERNSLHAMDGDKVKASLLARRKRHLREAQVVNYSLSNLDALVEVAAEEGYIKAGDKARLLQFRDNPSDESWMH